MCMFNLINHQLRNKYDQYYAFYKEILHLDFDELYELNLKFGLWI